MLIAELVNSCSHEFVARAAVLSLGSEFTARIDSAARHRGRSAGAYAARRVRRFADRADAAQWHSLADAMAGADMPVLSGLRHILECDLARHEAADEVKKTEGISPDCLYRLTAIGKAAQRF